MKPVRKMEAGRPSRLDGRDAGPPLVKGRKLLKRPKLAVWKFASCDGCQLGLLDCEDELLALTEEIEIANFVEASRAVVRGPYDLSLVEGSITNSHDSERIHQVRRSSRFLATIGACATAGGIQALRNFKDVKEFVSIVYARPEYIETLSNSTPISDHVRVDFELRGCPINKQQLVEVISAFLNGRKPNTPPHSVCIECKQRAMPGDAMAASDRSGRVTAAMDDGRIIEIKAGDIFYIAPGHDSWVIGEEPYVSLHLMGASDYASHKP